MDELEIVVTAKKMIVLYGTDAELVAYGHAETHVDCGEIQAAQDWQRVAAKIFEMLTGAGCGSSASNE